MIKVLVPVDFSEASKKALAFANSLSSSLEMEISLLHVMKVPSSGGTKLIHKMREMVKEEDKNIIQEKTSEFLKDIHLNKRLEEETVIRYGDVSKQIANVCLQMGYDLVIMGTKGTSWIKEKFIGSNTFYTLKISTVPVIIVPLVYDAKLVNKEACIALRFDKFYGDQCSGAITRTQRLGYEPKLLTVVDHANKTLQIDVKKDGHAFPLNIIQSESPRKAISEYVQKHGIGLLVLHFNAYSFFKELTYQSVSNEFAFRSKIPILFIK